MQQENTRNSLHFLPSLGAVLHVHWDVRMFRVQQLLLCRLMILKETQTNDRSGTNQLLISAKPFWPLGHNSEVMLMTSFCPPRDGQAGAAHLPPDGVYSLVQSSSSYNPPLLFSPLSVFISFSLLALLFYICWTQPAPRLRHRMSNAFLSSLRSFPRRPFLAKDIHSSCISRAFKPATYQT